MYTFAVQLTEEDYIRFNVTHFFNSPMSKKNKFTMQYITPLLMVLLSPLAAFFLHKSTGVPVVFVYAAFGIAIVLYMFRFKHFIYATIKKNVHKMEKSGKLPFDKNSTLTFSQDHIIDISEKGETKIYYTALEHIDQDENAFYIYHNTLQAFIVPLRVFASPDEQAQFYSFIQSKIGSGIPQ